MSPETLERVVRLSHGLELEYLMKSNFTAPPVSELGDWDRRILAKIHYHMNGGKVDLTKPINSDLGFITVEDWRYWQAEDEKFNGRY